MGRAEKVTGAVLGAGALLAFLVLASGRSKGTNVGGMATEKRPGILDSLSPKAREAADRLALSAAAAGLPLVWTSGRRSALDQAAAMLAKVERGEDLRKLYTSAGSTLDELFDLPKSAQAWAEVLDRRPISAHQRGDAVDVRRWELNADELRRLGELAIAAGWRRALLESDHLHLQL